MHLVHIFSFLFLFALFLIVGTKYQTRSNNKGKGLFAYSIRVCGSSWRAIQGGRHLCGGEDEVCCLDSYYGGQEAEKEQRLGPGYKTS